MSNYPDSTYFCMEVFACWLHIAELLPCNHGVIWKGAVVNRTESTGVEFATKIMRNLLGSCFSVTVLQKCDIRSASSSNAQPPAIPNPVVQFVLLLSVLAQSGLAPGFMVATASSRRSFTTPLDHSAYVTQGSWLNWLTLDIQSFFGLKFEPSIGNQEA
ncbi:hypothetical protein O6H91_18G031700 [Diphasiastrum complanatum]|uniref:Uncharacterized protein n=1 Tax=Diphasiastrum complanatum TaxID=34168 RepID=A0ACC2AZJ6_DIPCM|nr:hypothetical protein O6H91_18G031700 [Diphasiastrum complanatum]